MCPLRSCASTQRPHIEGSQSNARSVAVWKRLTVLWTLLRGDARRLWFALRHPAAPTWLKVGTALIVLYVVSPIDLIPDALPVIGVVDDLIIVPLAIRWLLARLPAEIVDAERRRNQPNFFTRR
jgi:uncharacterized membrane protein YkvA (DUF1232 family)